MTIDYRRKIYMIYKFQLSGDSTSEVRKQSIFEFGVKLPKDLRTFVSKLDALINKTDEKQKSGPLESGASTH
jgi:hypothetical protein